MRQSASVECLFSMSPLASGGRRISDLSVRIVVRRSSAPRRAAPQGQVNNACHFIDCYSGLSQQRLGRRHSLGHTAASARASSPAPAAAAARAAFAAKSYTLPGLGFGPGPGPGPGLDFGL